MAFIKTASLVGKTVILTRDMETSSGVFEQGTAMRITSKGDRGYDLVDDEGNVLAESGLSEDFFTVVEE